MWLILNWNLLGHLAYGSFLRVRAGAWTMKRRRGHAAVLMRHEDEVYLTRLPGYNFYFRRELCISPVLNPIQNHLYTNDIQVYLHFSKIKCIPIWVLLNPFKEGMLLRGICCVGKQNHVCLAFGFLGRGYCQRVLAPWATWLLTSICWSEDLSIWRLRRPGWFYEHVTYKIYIFYTYVAGLASSSLLYTNPELNTNI